MTDPELSAADDAVLHAARAAYVADTAPAPSASTSVVDTAMRAVAIDLRPARRLHLPGGGYVTDIAVANAVRLVLDGDDDEGTEDSNGDGGDGGDGGDTAVVARHCRVEQEARGWRVTLSVAVSYAHYQRHGDAAIRSRVVAALATLFGATATVVDIDVVDVYLDRPGTGAS